jgi:hypothetical protein
MERQAHYYTGLAPGARSQLLVAVVCCMVAAGGGHAAILLPPQRGRVPVSQLAGVTPPFRARWLAAECAIGLAVMPGR